MLRCRAGWNAPCCAFAAMALPPPARMPAPVHGLPSALGLPPTPGIAHAARLADLLAQLERAGERDLLLADIALAAERWLAADALPLETPADTAERVALARWLADFVPGGIVVHFGAHDLEVPTALASRGAAVHAHLDHPARAMLAATRLRAPRVTWAVVESGQPDPALARADLCVVETVGDVPVVPLDDARLLIHERGWVAVLGAPVAPSSGLIAVGSFAADRDGAVRPWPAERVGLAISLYRRRDG